MSSTQKLFIAGCGYIGTRVARLAHAAGWDVSALLRNPEKIGEIDHFVSRTVIAGLDDPASLPTMPTAGATVLYLVPPPGGGNTDPRMRNFCAAIPAGGEPARIIYMSTSGVYGDCGGKSVDESTPPDPQTARGKRRLDAETAVRDWGRVNGVPVIILRVTGIYGPGRLPLQHLMSGTPLLRESEAPVSNRIHADDLATICLAAAEKGEDGDIFNVSDGEHSTMTQYFNAVADLLGIARPGQIDREEAARTMPPLLYSYFSESRIIDNSRMLQKLGITLRYPTLVAGLPSCRPPG